MRVFPALLLSSCSLAVDVEALPVWDGRATLECDADACPDPRAVALALIIVDDAFADLFGQRSQRLRRIAIVWRDADACPTGCTGLGDRNDPARVHVFAPAFVTGSALAHELEHTIADDLWGNGDPGHNLAGLWRNPDFLDAYSIEDDAQTQIREADL